MTIAIAVVYALCVLSLVGFFSLIFFSEDLEKKGYDFVKVVVPASLVLLVVGILSTIALGILALVK